MRYIYFFVLFMYFLTFLKLSPKVCEKLSRKAIGFEADMLKE